MSGSRSTGLIRPSSDGAVQHPTSEVLDARRISSVPARLLRIVIEIRHPHDWAGQQGRRKRLLDIMKHFSEQRCPMRYAELKREDLVVGSGAVEGAVRNLVGMRLDGPGRPGMRWDVIEQLREAA